ncbi:MAG: choice-of-anchor D domain-containing protein [Candidatus Heimdallarchaeota archaeon]|nr:choice-of-anchor D domain-containing protein [Candidatus Heimdallarchaeota archaeon]
MKYLKILSVIMIVSVCFSSCASSKPQVVNISAKTLNYGIVFVGSSLDLQFKISNNTAKIYDITNIEITGADASDFSIKSGWSGSITLNTRDEIEIVIEFAPNSGGTKEAQIEITHTYPIETSPKTVSLIAKSVIDALLESDPIKHHFGFIPVGNSDTMDFELCNAGPNDLDITDMLFSGIGASAYEITTGWTGNPVQISVGCTEIITVKFSPNSDGQKIAQLHIVHSGSNSPCIIDVTGGGGYGYIMETFAVGMDSICNTGTPVVVANYLDDEWFNINLGFTFKYYGQDFSSAWVCDNGWISFGQDPNDPAYENFNLPSAGLPNAAIYPFWDDVELNEANVPDTKWITERQGVAPSRVFVVEWFKLNRYNTAPASVATYQLRLYETSNIIEFHYSIVPGHWANANWTATIGLEDENASKFIEISGSPSISKRPIYNYRFIP